MDEFYKVVFSRSSCRSFDEKPVPEEKLLRILEAANAAPSAHNAQPWHFCVILGEKSKQTLFEVAGKVYVSDLMNSGMPEDEARKRADDSKRFFCAVPVLIIVFVEHMDDAGDKRGDIERALREESAAAAIAQLLLAAEHEGLGACWYCMPHYCPRVFRDFAGLGETYEPIALIALGYAANEPKRREKRPLSEKMNVIM